MTTKDEKSPEPDRDEESSLDDDQESAVDKEGDEHVAKDAENGAEPADADAADTNEPEDADSEDAQDNEDPPSEAAAEDSSTAEESAPPSDASPWDAKIAQANALWEAGNNAELRKLLDELAKAPADEKAVHELVADMRNRLKPDPIAIGLWVATLAIFCLLTYLYVLS